MKRGPEEGQGRCVSMAGVLASWGPDAPEWIVMLARMSDKTSQGAVGKQINYSGSAVNAVLRNRYTGDLNAIEKAVKGCFMGLTVTCPEEGEIAADRCIEHQKLARRFCASSVFRVRMYRACRACPLSRFTADEPEGV